MNATVANNATNTGADVPQHANYASYSWPEIKSTIVIGSAIGLAMMVIFELARSRDSFKSIYQPRKIWMPGRHGDAPDHILGWTVMVNKMTNTDVRRTGGLDAYMYLRYLQLCFRTALFASAWGVLLLAPMYAWEGAAAHRQTGFYLWSLLAVPAGSPAYYWVVGLAYLYMLHLMFLMRQEFRRYAALREELLCGRDGAGHNVDWDPDLDRQTLFTVMVEGVPEEMRSSDRLEELFEELFPGQVHSVQLYLHDGGMRRLKRALGERAAAVARVEARAAESRLDVPCLPCQKQGMKTAQKKDRRRLKKLNRLIAMEQNKWRELQRTGKLPPEEGPPGRAAAAAAAAAATGEGGRGGGGGGGDWRAAGRRKARAKEDELFRNEDLHEEEDEEEARGWGGGGGGGGRGGGKARAAAGERAPLVAAAGKKKASPSPRKDERKAAATAAAEVSWRRDSFVSESARDLADSKNCADGMYQGLVMNWRRAQREARLIYELLALGAPSGAGAVLTHLGYLLNPLPSSGCDSSTAFVTFTTLSARAAALQMVLDEQPQKRWVVTAAPEPRDVLWNSVPHRLPRIQTRRMASLAIRVVGVVFWAGIVTSIQALVSVDSLERVFPWLSAIEEAFPNTYSILHVQAPVAALLALLTVLPYLLQLLEHFYVGAKARSAVQGAVLVHFFWYQLANVYVSILSGSIWAALQEIIERPRALPLLLGTALPHVAVYFTNVIIFKILVGLPLELVRPWPLFQELLGRVLWPGKARVHRALEEIRAHGAPRPPELQYGWYYPNMLFVLLIVLVYALISPLVAPVGALFFGCSIVVFKYQVVTCYVPRYESQGRFWFRVYRQTVLALVTAQVTLLGYLLAKGATRYQLLAAAALPAFTVAYGARTRAEWGAAFQELSLRRARALDAGDHRGVLPRPGHPEERVYLEKHGSSNRSEPAGRGGGKEGGGGAAPAPALAKLKSAAEGVMRTRSLRLFRQDSYLQPALRFDPAIPRGPDRGRLDPALWAEGAPESDDEEEEEKVNNIDELGWEDKPNWFISGMKNLLFPISKREEGRKKMRATNEKDYEAIQ